MAIKHMPNQSAVRHIRWSAMKMCITAVIVLLVAALAHAGGEDQKRRSAISIDHLLSNAKLYAGKDVSVVAYVNVALEDMTLCSEKSAKVPRQCVWLEIDNGPYETDADEARYKSALARWSKLSGKLAIVRGTFSTSDTGHFGMFPGALGHITEAIEQ